MTITSSIVQQLKSNSDDHEWYPSTDSQIQIIIDDLHRIHKTFNFNGRYNDSSTLLDIGAGDGRVLEKIKMAFNDSDLTFETHAIEKASTHTDTYMKKGITLLGTEFHETNFISKTCDVAFVNPPYSEFSIWLQTLISQLSFSVLYAIVPERWQEDEGIAQALKLRGLEYSSVLASSDFLTADRAARAKVQIIRFSFVDIDKKCASHDPDGYKRTFRDDTSDPFTLFIENELGLSKSYSETTEKFNEYREKERVKASMETEGTASYEVATSKGVLWALLENYESDLERTLNQYKLIGQLDPVLLKELGVSYDGIKVGVKEKLFGFRNVYWALLFEHLDTLSNRLITKHRQHMLNKLSQNALDFTYKNAIYIISYAVEMANELIEQSLIDVYKGLTSSDSIQKYYKSNEHVFEDNWRYSRADNSRCRYLLDYRFIHSSYSNFSSSSWDRGLNEGARSFTSDLLVCFKLLGYTNLYMTNSFQRMDKGDKLSIMGTDNDGNVIQLVEIKYYLNGNRHIRFDKKAMLRFNVTVSRLLGWVRSKEDLNDEAELKEPVTMADWGISESMKVLPSSVLMVTDKTQKAA